MILWVAFSAGCFAKDELREGRFGAYQACTVTDVPAEVGLSGIYSQYLFCSGIPIVAPDGVRPEALRRADETMGFMAEGNEAAFAEMNRRDQYFILRPAGTGIGDLPEEFPDALDSLPAAYWGDVGAGTSGANNILCEIGAELPGYENLFVATFAEQMAEAGLQHTEPDFIATMTAAADAVSEDDEGCRELRPINNPFKYFAKITTVWFEAGHPVPPEDRAGAMLLDTRAELRSCDRIGADYVAATFGSSFDLPSCIRLEMVDLFEDINARCGNVVPDAQGGRYDVVQIGNQCWMAENLAATQYDNLVIISNYGEYPGAEAVDGRLYDYNHVTSADGLCPEGWRVPTLEDTMELENYVGITGGGASEVASRLRAIGEWSSGVSATDSTAFAAHPSGAQLADDTFEGLGQRFVMWTSTIDPTTTTRAIARRIDASGESFQVQMLDRNSHHSVRCMKP